MPIETSGGLQARSTLLSFGAWPAHTGGDGGSPYRPLSTAAVGNAAAVLLGTSTVSRGLSDSFDFDCAVVTGVVINAVAIRVFIDTIIIISSSSSIIQLLFKISN